MFKKVVNFFKRERDLESNPQVAIFENDLKRVVEILSANNFAMVREFAMPKSEKRIVGDVINHEVLFYFASLKVFPVFHERFGFENAHDAANFQAMINHHNHYGTLKNLSGLKLSEVVLEQHRNFRRKLREVVDAIVMTEQGVSKRQRTPVTAFDLRHLAENGFFVELKSWFGFQSAQEALLFQEMLLSEDNLAYLPELIIDGVEDEVKEVMNR